ncbi:hypothetical protein ACG33_07260 [Steroidobacter denitrificans]|uniref:SnoaL-like domain-containing protein n=1 Tax=Steroidobacter denitrificans TaxID=465721 RepID=A0A127F903_STEDE|nr:nuclear transport factor 2 family protein [Steroidobacter denitrificans]AMN46897.1 hypothetical protein ACG33_07260 [Steroidobacter denitrificans]
MNDDLKYLRDRADLTDLINKYATGIDTRDWALYRSIFADEVDIDFSSYDGQPAARMRGDDWVAAVQMLLPGFDVTQHLLANMVFDIRGDTATVTVYMQAEHFLTNGLGDSSHTLGGYYTHRIRLGMDGWKIHGVTLNVTWNRGNRHVYELARQRVAERRKLPVAT